MKFFLIFVSLLNTASMYNLLHAEVFSASHVGFGLEDNPNSGIRNRGGSMLLFDWALQLKPDIAVGIKTMANGAQAAHASLFRLTSGPAIHYRWENFELHYSLGYFRETTEVRGDAKHQTSADGHSHTISFNRYKELYEGVAFGWGSYLTLSYGTMRPERSTSSIQQIPWSYSRHYQSTSRGIFGSLKVDL